MDFKINGTALRLAGLQPGAELGQRHLMNQNVLARDASTSIRTQRSTSKEPMSGASWIP